MRRKLRYEVPRGPVAMPAKAWGEEFAVMLFGDDAPRAPFREEGSYAVVDICGPLSQKSGWWSESYDEIRDRVAAALASQCASVCLKIDSPGGDYSGALELSRDLRAMASAVGKNLVAFTDTMALSAGYALACAASEIVTTESGQVGSIGVWAPLVDVTAQDAMYGVKYAFVASGTAKVDRNPHVGITDEAYARLQGQIDVMASNFFALVAESRPGVTADQARALDGAEFFGSRGMQAGLSDRVVNSWSSFINETESPMPTAKAKTDTYKEALGKAREALQKCAEGDDEDAKKAKETLAALGDDKEEKAADGAPPPSDDDKKKDEEAAKKAEDEKKEEQMKALASSNLELARKVVALENDAKLRAAKEKTDADASARASLFAKRPDFGPEVRAALASLPIADLEKAVKTFPRVAASPGAAAGAMVPAVSGGERVAKHAPVMSAEEQTIYDRLNAGSRGPVKSYSRGNTHFTPFVTPEEAKARLAELDKEGV